MQNLEDLKKDIRSCDICSSVLPHGARPVVQLGSNAKILIAGQAPGKRVHDSGIPFNDPSGDRLRDWMGLTKEEFYDSELVAILPMGFCYPGTGKSGDYPPRPECIEAWREKTLSALPSIGLTLVIGKYAIEYHLKEKHSTVTETVKSWEKYWPKAIPLPHPSPRNNLWLKRNPWFETEVLPSLRKKVREFTRSELTKK